MEVDDFSVLKGCPWPEFWHGEGNALAIAAVESARRRARPRGSAAPPPPPRERRDIGTSRSRRSWARTENRLSLLSISRDVTAEREAIERQQFLLKELEHRVKNNLSIIVAIASRTFHGDEHRAARETFIARVMNLAQANEILDGVALDRNTRPPHRGRGARCNGASTRTASGSQALRSASAPNRGWRSRWHSTNSAPTHSNTARCPIPEGRVEISWDQTTADGAQTFEFAWRETGGPPVACADASGFRKPRHPRHDGRGIRRDDPAFI